MSASRTSSASFARAPFPELHTGADRLNWRAGNAVHAEPKPPPPTFERQKEEGFAKFLKKHSSPTHNRITAGGRIVPMEPHARSPPPFTLAGNVSGRPHGSALDLTNSENLGKPRSSNLTPKSDLRRYQQTSSEEQDQSLHFQNDPWQMQEMLPGQPDIYYQPTTMTGAYEQQISPSAFTNAVMVPSPVRNTYGLPQSGGPVMQPMPTQSYGMTDYMARPNMGTGISLADSFTSHNVQPPISEPFAQPMGMPVQQSPHQLLAAWEQHYTELDQQLKNIDRHRAMSNLDPSLAGQRRAIVQQRSDAKDVIKEIQGMLGIRRYFDSSSESWNAGFNVEAPAYVPHTFMPTGGPMLHKTSYDTFQGSPVLEKPRSAGQKRVIPIVAPADKNNHIKASNHDGSGATIDTATNAQRWSDESASHVVSGTHSQALALHDSSDESRKDSASADSTSASAEVVVFADQQNESSVLEIVPPRRESPRHQHEEIEILLRAIQQPKHIITQVRLLDGRVIDVEGQGIELSTTLPLPDYGPLAPISNPNVNTTPVKHSRQSSMAGKENYAAVPRFHQKAVTDAYVGRYHNVSDILDGPMQPETQSLRTASNSHSIHSAPMAGAYMPLSTQLISRENLHNINYGTPVRVPSQYKPVEAVFEDMSISMDEPNNKGYSMVSVQNVHAVGSLPNNFDGAIEARQSVQAQLASASKTRSPRSPRLLRRFGGNGGA